MGNLLKQLRENPYLGQYLKESLLNKIPFVNRDDQEERAYLGARGSGLGKFMGRPDLSENMMGLYDDYGAQPEAIVDLALRGPDYKQYPPFGFPVDKAVPPTEGAPTQEVLGEMMGMGEPMPQAPVMAEPGPDFGQFASDWYSSVGHGEQADKAALIASKAAEYGVDPYMALALTAQEGGWARYDPADSPHNYFGWGVTDSGDMGYSGDSLEGWLDTYMPQIAEQYGGREKLTDWGGSLKGHGIGSPYTARYNYNDSWVEALSSLINQADAFRQDKYPELPGPSIDPSYPY